MTDQQPAPLWEWMQDAYMSAAIDPGRQANECYAAEIEALADWLVPEELACPRAEFDCEPNLKGRDGTMRHDWQAHMRRRFVQDDLKLKWEQRQELRQRLLDEARRAREGT